MIYLICFIPVKYLKDFLFIVKEEKLLSCEDAMINFYLQVSFHHHV